MYRILAKVNALSGEMERLSDADLQAVTGKLRGELRNGAALDSLLPRAFAAMREASKRVLGKFPYDVQVLGGIALHQGKIAEMKTGEGKTLVATMPLYLNALKREFMPPTLSIRQMMRLPLITCLRTWNPRRRAGIFAG